MVFMHIEFMERLLVLFEAFQFIGEIIIVIIIIIISVVVRVLVL